MTPSRAGDQALALYRQGRIAEALTCFERALALTPEQATLWNDYGTLLSEVDRPAEAIAAYDRAIALEPRIEHYYNRGNALRQMNRQSEAIASYNSALAINPNLLQAWNNRGSAQLAVSDYQGALASFDKVLAVHPAAAEIWNNRGVALTHLQKRQDALDSYDRALAIQPAFARAWDNRGSLLRDLARPAEALASHDRALAIDPGLAEAWFNRGNILREEHRPAEALASYDRALASKPDHVEGWVNRAIALRDLKRIPDAIASYGNALVIDPNHVEALVGRGMIAWVENQDYDAAQRDLERAVSLDPDFPYALGGLVLVKQYGGDWRDYDSDVARIDDRVRAGKPVAEPFLYQAISASPADLQACSVIHARHRYPQAPLPMRPMTPQTMRRAGKIRIGYVSGEFREQATAHLMAGVYECHDKTRFAITAFDNGGSDHSAMRRRLEAAVDEFVDIAALSDTQAAGIIAEREIDILINLNGYFGDHRMGVFAQRAAPIQVTYLGFPATLGAPYIDYIIADHTVIPQGEERFYTEQVVRLPHSYQANDSKRSIAANIPGRVACGLPAEGFVFCNFNAGYKLTPQTFAGWMRILRQTPASVLWLLEGDPHFSVNLRRQAETLGVTGERLIFAPLAPLATHLARLQLADLFLDSLPYNAHTTASDALWAGVPLITCRGSTFPGRVAASLLDAIGMGEMITADQDAYESLAIRLADDPGMMENLRRKLAQNRLTTPLFDTGQFCRHLETAYETMLANGQRGQPPSGFDVAPSVARSGDAGNP